MWACEKSSRIFDVAGHACAATSARAARKERADAARADGAVPRVRGAVEAEAEVGPLGAALERVAVQRLALVGLEDAVQRRAPDPRARRVRGRVERPRFAGLERPVAVEEAQRLGLDGGVLVHERRREARAAVLGRPPPGVAVARAQPEDERPRPLRGPLPDAGAHGGVVGLARGVVVAGVDERLRHVRVVLRVAGLEERRLRVVGPGVAPEGLGAVAQAHLQPREDAVLGPAEGQRHVAQRPRARGVGRRHARRRGPRGAVRRDGGLGAAQGPRDAPQAPPPRGADLLRPRQPGPRRDDGVDVVRGRRDGAPGQPEAAGVVVGVVGALALRVELGGVYVPEGRAARARVHAVLERRGRELVEDLGSKRVIPRRFNVSVPRARVSETTPMLRERFER